MDAVVLLLPILILLAGGLACLACGRSARANSLGAAVSIVGGLAAAAASVRVLAGGPIPAIDWPWSVPFGQFSLAMDDLSAWFVLPIAIVTALGGLYARAYLHGSVGRRNLGFYWLSYHVLAASMLAVTTARSGMLFLLAWEIMSLSSLLLVMFEHHEAQVRKAGWTYLVATHLGTAALLAMFILMGSGALVGAGGTDLVGSSGTDALSGTGGLSGAAALSGAEGLNGAAAVSGAGGLNVSAGLADLTGPGWWGVVNPSAAGAIFILALVGFGTKAGLVPMHVWLPEAHPAAPSHVSAVMSGVMIKTGIYGLLRTLTLVGEPACWWGWTLLGAGAAAGVFGILMTLVQRDVKRLLAYSSVENIGIICLGMGLGVLGLTYHVGAMAVLGFGGALLHVWSHAIGKGLLFMGAGSIVHAAGTRDIEKLGSLAKRMPTTAAAMMLASAAVAGLPPLSGFVGELAIYVGSFSAISSGRVSGAVMAGLVAVAALAMIGGLAAACFARLVGVALLGEPRSQAAADAHEAPRPMRSAMLVLSALCVLMGLCGAVAMWAAEPVIRQLANVPAASAIPAMQLMQGLLWKVGLVGGIAIALVVSLAMLRRRLLSRRLVGSTVTWDCGYVAPTSRMQYTASSFTWPIVAMFGRLIGPIVRLRRPEGPLPRQASFETDGPDAFGRWFYGPIFRGADWLSGRFAWVQQGRIQLYILYIAVTLLALLIWKLR